MKNRSPPSTPLVTGLPPKRGVRGGRVGFTAERRGNDQTQLQGQKRFPRREFGCWAATLEVTVFPSLLARFSQRTKLFLPLPSKKSCSTRAEMVLCSLTGEPGCCCCGAGEDSLCSQKHGTEVRQQTLCVMAEGLSGATPSPPGHVSPEQSKMEQEKQQSQTSHNLTCFESCTFSAVVITPLQ